MLLDADYRTIVVDPPWQPTLGETWNSRMRDKAGPQRFYETMSVTEIIAVRPRMAAQAHVYIWCLTQHVDWGYELARAWDAEPITLLTWKKPGLGAGRFRCNTEHVLVARVGPRAGNPFGPGGRHAQATAGTFFEWPRARHSEKPLEFFSLVEHLSPAPRLEMYARGPRNGWKVWGRESDGQQARPIPPSRRAAPPLETDLLL
jgi:N6-adenosine-specific RNA methylase IME4